MSEWAKCLNCKHICIQKCSNIWKENRQKLHNWISQLSSNKWQPFIRDNISKWRVQSELRDLWHCNELQTLTSFTVIHRCVGKEVFILNTFIVCKKVFILKREHLLSLCNPGCTCDFQWQGVRFRGGRGGGSYQYPLPPPPPPNTCLAEVDGGCKLSPVPSTPFVYIPGPS